MMELLGRRVVAILVAGVIALVASGRALTLASNSLAQDPNNLLYLDLPMPAGAKISLGPAQLVLPVLRKPISR
jgi:hypothetical protein